MSLNRFILKYDLCINVLLSAKFVLPEYFIDISYMPIFKVILKILQEYFVNTHDILYVK